MSSQVTYDVDPVFHCWIWTGKLGGNGRPIVWRGRSPISAYRMLYEEQVGVVPDDLVLDHMCRRELCVNPEHLEAVSKHDNERRKAMRYRLARKQCKRGHVLSEVTRVVTPEMGVLCRACMTPGVGGTAQGGPG